jgi:hypothetical protein
VPGFSHLTSSSDGRAWCKSGPTYRKTISNERGSAKIGI